MLSSVRPAWEAATTAPAGAQRPRRLKLQPRSKDAGKVGGYAKSSQSRSSIFGSAKPREEVLKAKGIDAKKKDEELDKKVAYVPKMSQTEQLEYQAMAESIAAAKTEITNAASEVEITNARQNLKALQEERAEFIKNLKPAPRGEPMARAPAAHDGYGEAPHMGYGERHAPTSGSKVFVGSLAYATTDDVLRRAFSACGEILSANVVFDRATGTSKGFGFVHFRDPAGAHEAMMSMNGQFLEARQINVRLADSGGRGGGRRGDRGGYGPEPTEYLPDDGGDFTPNFQQRGGYDGGYGYNAPMLGAHADLDAALEGDDQ